MRTSSRTFTSFSKYDEDRGRILLGHRRRAAPPELGRAAGAQLGEARAGRARLASSSSGGEGAAERRVKTTYEVLLDTHGGEPRRRPGAVIAR